MDTIQQTSGQTAPRSLPVRLRLFGVPAGAARATVVDRDARWRIGRAALTLAASLALAALGALVPPHVPWAVTILVVGFALAARRLGERRTLVALSGTCPGCGAEQTLPGPTRLRTPHPLRCPGCARRLELELADADVP